MINPKRSIFVSINDLGAIDLSKLAESMTRFQFTECKPEEEESWGFTPAEDWIEGQEILYQADQFALVTLRYDRKVPKKSRLSRLWRAACEKKKKELGAALDKVQREEVREQVKKSLLPETNPSETIVQAIVVRECWLVVLTSNYADADLMVEKLNRALEPQEKRISWVSTSVKPELSETLTAMLMKPEIAEAAGYYVGSSMRLEKEKSGKANLRDQEADTAEVREHLHAGKEAHALQVIQKDSDPEIKFVITNKRALTQIDMKNVLKRQADEELGESQDADAYKQGMFVIACKALLELWSSVETLPTDPAEIMD
ncbi:recombination-associated protein RdgC [Marinobacterium jannaschii]|uniref:recombination-associated protein RdgC n=1 Tax=Marinobacterium jannaschii TaxID=64970 RepID=UPI00048459DB|nr:recombination-associated protein RdgC [Marinobacterium jannaschii]